MTLNCELFQSEFSVLSGRLIKNMFPLHICRPNDYTIEISVLLQFYNIYNFTILQFSFTIFLLTFLPLFSKLITNILKIYERPKTYKILKKWFTIIIYQVNSMSQVHLASEFYWMYIENVPILYNKPCLCTGD